MSKKRKITLTLAAIIVAIGGGAQFYTNQQVDKVLQKFPYSLDNQLSLKVTETAKNSKTMILLKTISSISDNY